MKKILILLLILVFCSTVNAAGILRGVLSSSSISGPTCTGSSPVCMGRETFNTCNAACSSGCDNKWVTDIGAGTCNDTTSPAPLEGTQSFGGLTSSDNMIHTALATAQSSLYVAAEIYIVTYTTGSPGIIFVNNSYTSTIAGIRAVGSNQYSKMNSGSSYIAPATVPIGSKFYFKFYAATGTGSNALLKWWTSTDGKTWTLQQTSSNGTWTSLIAQVGMEWDAENTIIDDIRWDSQDINY